MMLMSRCDSLLANWYPIDCMGVIQRQQSSYIFSIHNSIHIPSIKAGVYLGVRKGYLMCSQMTYVVMGLLWLTQLDQLALRETPGGIDDHAHRLHLEEVAKVVTAIPVLVTCNNSA